MRRSTRLAISRLAFLISECDLYPRFCSCRRPIERLVTEDIRKALDEVEKALATEPAEHWINHVEVD
jgi:hypothetical protein